MIKYKTRPFWSLLLLIAFVECQRTEWDASNFPNPTAGDFKRCSMMTTASICDPDAVLTKDQRYRINHELHQLESRTRQDSAPDFCQKKGITGAMAIVKHVRDGSEQAVRDMANQMLKKWTLDNQCQKSVVFVVAVDDKKFWVARDPRVPIYAAEFNQIFADQKQLFSKGDYAQGLGNILQQTWEKAISKQGPRTGGDGGTDGGRGVAGIGGGGRGGGMSGGGDPYKKKPAISLPKIPMVVWIVLICVIVPLLLCCCCICYCCCCKKGSGGNRRQQPSDMEGGEGPDGGHGGRGGRGRGGGGFGFGNILSGLGGAGLGNLAGRLLSGGGRRGMGGGGMGGGFNMDSGHQGGGAYPAGPSYRPSGKSTGGGGLYPNERVVDQGGGGGW